MNEVATTTHQIMKSKPKASWKDKNKIPRYGTHDYLSNQYL